MYEKQVEEALVNWLPNYYQSPARITAIERQVHMPNGGRADIVVVSVLDDEPRQLASIDIWELKRGQIDVEAMAQVATYADSLLAFYYDFFLKNPDSTLRPDHDLRVVRHLVGASVAKHPLLQVSEDFTRLWTYRVKDGQFIFDPYYGADLPMVAAPPGLLRMFSSLAWTRLPSTKIEG